MKKFLYSFVLASSLINLSVTSSGVAQSNLLVTPTRIEFSGSKRFEVLSVTNTGLDTATYRMSFIHYHMRVDGFLDKISTPDSGQYFADSLLRFYPRQVTLAPGMSQTIRMQLNKPDDLLSGEYRSHLVFRNISSRKANDDSSDSTEGFQVALKAICSVAIPVIIYHNVSEPLLAITDASLKQKDTSTELTFKILREGAASAYGDIALLYRLPNGDKTLLNLIKGVGIYSPNTYRTCSIKVDKIPSGTTDFIVEYRKHGKAAILADRKLPVSLAVSH